MATRSPATVSQTSRRPASKRTPCGWWKPPNSCRTLPVEVADEHAIVAGVGDRDPARRRPRRPCPGRRACSRLGRETGVKAGPDGEIAPAIEELCDHAARAPVRCPRRRPSRPRSRQGRSRPASARRERRTAATSPAPGRPAPGGRSDGGRRLAATAAWSASCGNFGECTPITTSRSPKRSSSGRSSSMTRRQLMQQNVQKSSTHHASAEIAQRQRLIGVDPSAGAAELRCANPSECGGHASIIIARRAVSSRDGRGGDLRAA